MCMCAVRAPVCLSACFSSHLPSPQPSLLELALVSSPVLSLSLPAPAAAFVALDPSFPPPEAACGPSPTSSDITTKSLHPHLSRRPLRARHHTARLSHTAMRTPPNNTTTKRPRGLGRSQLHKSTSLPISRQLCTNRFQYYAPIVLPAHQSPTRPAPSPLPDPLLPSSEKRGRDTLLTHHPEAHIPDHTPNETVTMVRGTVTDAAIATACVEEGIATPTLISPPESKTPPTATHKRNQHVFAAKAQDQNSDAVDPTALSKALADFEHAGRARERTPIASPSRKRARIHGDRFIPNRAGQDLQASFNLLHEDGSPATPSKARRTPHSELHFQKTEEANRTYSAVLRHEMFEGSVPQAFPQSLSPTDSANMRTGGRSHTPPTRATTSLPPSTHTPSTPHKNLFSYAGQPTPSRTPSSRHGVLNLNAHSDLYSLSPIKYSSQRMLLSPQRAPRAVSKVPYKVLDAPDLADDFYLNLVDWGSQNTLGVGLGSCVYMWNSASGRVTKLCELTDDSVTSVNWIQRVSIILPSPK
ncbi:predicted protein [Plenodomus lingam JN3]|uniref:Predicted protein n=1 Tax=Leptosphaeria maculans (strain JN3 / isolate v23.1.3 / race Av1-4-5-6-7-8) TaxID=985895 RepID=E4ZTZ3_LEPMJ|nr:predicted protein [Plenodomus lingam JN3]CBX94703.1 predicted protein [Plenodomus lingam JN3]